MTTLRRTIRWAWPIDARQHPDISARAILRGFLLRLGVYGALGIATWAHWYQAVRP